MKKLLIVFLALLSSSAFSMEKPGFDFTPPFAEQLANAHSSVDIDTDQEEWYHQQYLMSLRLNPSSNAPWEIRKFLRTEENKREAPFTPKSAAKHSLTKAYSAAQQAETSPLRRVLATKLSPPSKQTPRSRYRNPVDAARLAALYSQHAAHILEALYGTSPQKGAIIREAQKLQHNLETNPDALKPRSLESMFTRAKQKDSESTSLPSSPVHFGSPVEEATVEMPPARPNKRLRTIRDPRPKGSRKKQATLGKDTKKTRQTDVAQFFTKNK